MKKKIHNLATSLMVIALASVGINLQAAEAPQSVILESFACSYHEGKGRDDLLAARDYMVKQAAKANVALAPSYVWHSFKGGPAELDHIWFSVHENLASFAAESEAFAAAPELAGVGARFDAVADCTSNIATASPLFQGGETPPPGGDVFIASNACMLQPGVGPGELADLRTHINMVLGGIDAYKATTIIAATPMTSGPESADLYIFGVNSSPSAWAATSAAFQASADSASLRRHFTSLMNCKSSLWTAEQVVGGEG